MENAKEPGHSLPALMKIKGIYSSLNPAEKKAADFILQNPQFVAERHISDVAKTAGCSVATLSRFARRVGYENYRDLRADLQYTTESGSAVFYPDVKPDDDYEDILNKVFQSSIRTIEYTLAAIDMEEYRKLVEALSRASRVAFFAIGDAASVAQAGYYKFARIGYQSSWSSDPDVTLVSGSFLKENDVAVGISYSGRTTTVINALEQSKAAGATTIAVTNFPLSPVAEVADHVLLTAAFAESGVGELMAHRVAQLCVLEALWVGVLHTRMDSLKEVIPYIHEILQINKVK
jgi:RpiR family carbohydrate utilization transcriptional regulator